MTFIIPSRTIQLLALTGCLALAGAARAEDAISPPASPCELFATGLAGHTAMCCDGQGNVLATNYRHLGSVGKISQQDGAALLFDAPLAVAEPVEASSLVGIALDDDQRILVLDSQLGRVLRYAPESKMVTTLADRIQGRRFDSLFAIDIGPGGNIYFSEPERVSGGDATGSLYRFDVVTNRPVLLVDGLDQPTGISLSSDGKSLYVAESGRGQISVYGINQQDGTAEKVAAYFLTLLLDVDDPKEIGRLGHIAIDRRNWLYVSLWDRGEVAVIDTTNGKLIEVISCHSDSVFGLTLWQDALLMSIPEKEAIYRYDLRPLIGRHAP
ncbi:Gluconolactonase precursor [Bremerella volcania]|uniref:Gluconolactonase n=1 Tax=Bremerella volcania TaxID=2527984 RepID=A0A518C7D9_9BACT|nr:SMP-30/gluconolactonase/LRE family protein [Bremerella volcania]QDU75139.1 Gluconolactonase precursor [Bremerella volcania]